jgi:hypothetical protein
MDRYYNTKKDDGDDDLSGCLASGFLGKQPNTSSKATVRQQSANDNSSDLSGCLASGFLSKQPKGTRKVTPPPPPPRKSFIPPSDEDLSGCLASGFLGKPAHNLTPQFKPAVAAKDEDLSGCLASGSLKRNSSNPASRNTGDLSGSLPGGFRTRQIAARIVQPAQTSAETELDDSPASDWFYTN